MSKGNRIFYLVQYIKQESISSGIAGEYDEHTTPNDMYYKNGAMKSSNCPEWSNKNNTSIPNDDTLTPNVTLKSSEINDGSNVHESSVASEASAVSDHEIDVENNTIASDFETDNNNNTVDDTMDDPDYEAGDESNTVQDFHLSKTHVHHKILARKLMARRKFLSRPSINQSSLLDYFDTSNLPFKRAKSLPKTPTSGYFTRSKSSSFKANNDDTSALNILNSTLMSDTSAVNVENSSFEPEVSAKINDRKLKDNIFKFCLKCNKTFNSDERVKYCGRCRLILKYKCMLCGGIYGTMGSAYAHLSIHSRKNQVTLLRTDLNTEENSSDMNTTNGMENSMYNEEASSDNMSSEKHYNHICMKCDKIYESATKCKDCQIPCPMKCMYCNEIYNTLSGVNNHVRVAHSAYLSQNESANISAIDSFQNVENISNSRKRKITNDISDADIVKDFDDFPNSRKRKIDNKGSMIDTSGNVKDELRSTKRNIDRNVTECNEVNDVEECDVKTYMFLNCLVCNYYIQQHDGNIIPCIQCNQNMVLKCYLCNVHVNTADEVKNHIKIHMTNEQDYIACLKCRKSIPRSYIRYHLQFCKKLVEYSCKFCKYHTTQDGNLISHIFRQHPDIHLTEGNAKFFKEFDNSGVQKQIKNSSSGSHGLKSKNKNTASYVTSKKGRINSKGILFQCQLCPYSSQFANNLSRHIISQHLTDAEYNVIDFINEAYNTNLDEKRTSAKHHNHIDDPIEAKKPTHSKYADVSIVDASTFTNQEDTSTTYDARNLIFMYCSLCKKPGERYDSKNAIKNCENCKCVMHYKCIKCDKVYNRYKTIIYHIKSQCCIEKWYNCNRCSYSTPVWNLMHRHVQRHQGLLPKRTKKIQPQPPISKQLTNEHNTEIETRTENPKIVSKVDVELKDIPIDNQDNVTITSIPRRTLICLKCNSKISAVSFHHKYCGKEPSVFCKLCPFKTKYRSNLFAHYRTVHSFGKRNVENSILFNLKNNATNEDMKNTNQPLKVNINSAETEKYIEEYCVNCCGIPQSSVMKPMGKCKKCKINLLFRCTKCDVMYPKREILERHVKRHLTNSYKCTNCSKCFAIPENLKKHEIICKSRTTC